MTRTGMTDGNWGERRLSARARRKRAIRGVMIAAAVAFGIFAPQLIPAGPHAAGVKLVLSLAYMAVIAIGAGLLWRQTDEVERRIAINAFAAMGFVTLFAGIAVPLAVPVLGIAYPLMTLWVIGLIAFGASYLTQRLRG